MEPNRRRYPRVRAHGLAAHLRSSRGRAQCVVENISLGGLFLRTDQLEDVGTSVSLLLVKPGWKKQLVLTARVTSRIEALGQNWRVPGLGLQFTELDGDSHERLRSLLRQLGAPDSQPEVTLPDDSVEVELRTLDPVKDGARASSAGPAPRLDGVGRTASRPPPPPQDALGDERPAGKSELEIARLQLQLRGIAMQLSDAQQLIVARDEEIERLREELESAKALLKRTLSGQ
ncbi:MAG TPA: PilZ domain-containing protein [Myxococcales bacterium]|nr:PilZ domain-containing protein [Myxococcales bacterium]